MISVATVTHTVTTVATQTTPIMTMTTGATHTTPTMTMTTVAAIIIQMSGQIWTSTRLFTAEDKRMGKCYSIINNYMKKKYFNVFEVENYTIILEINQK